MKKILFPTEFSAHAGQVFLYALDIAKKQKASVTLMHAYRVPINPSTSMKEVGNQAMQELEDFADSNIPKEYQDVPVHFIAEMGFPAEAILKVSEEEEMDLIVMGMKGKTNKLESYFGSVALDVTNQTDRSVFLVPTTNRFKPIKEIAYAFDFKMADLLGLQRVNELLGRMKASITCIHFNEDKSRKGKVRKMTAFLIDLFDNHLVYNSISFFNKEGVFEEGIQDYITKTGTDLLITQTHTRNWKFRFVDPGSSDKIARKINIPMLVLKE